MKPYVESKDSKDKNDEEESKAALMRFLQRNKSFVVDRFFGQFKSKLVCPKCTSHKVTFDPFSIIGLPIP